MGDKFTTYELPRGEYLDERVDSLPRLLEQHFEGHVTTSTETTIDGQSVTCHIVDSNVDGLNRVAAAKVDYPRKKTAIAVRFVETRPQNLSPQADAGEAVEAKNGFLHAATGLTAEDRRERWESDVED